MASNADSRPVVVAYDGSTEAGEAVRTAATLFAGRPVMVVSVWEPGWKTATLTTPYVAAYDYVPPSPETIEAVDRVQSEHAEAIAAAGARIAADAGATADALPVADRADVAETLVEIADEHDAAALVVGSRGRGRMKSALLGSTSRRVLHDTHRPVVVVRAPDAAED